MERKDFIEKVGLSAASVLIFGCLQSCSKSDTNTSTYPPASGSNNNTPTTNKVIDFTINIANSPYSNLSTAGGFYLDKVNSILIARTLANEFIAVSSVCTHQQVTIDFEAKNNRFHCSAHGSAFSTKGAVLNGPAAEPLKQYKTTLSGNDLRVYA